MHVDLVDILSKAMDSKTSLDNISKTEIIGVVEWLAKTFTVDELYELSSLYDLKEITSKGRE